MSVVSNSSPLINLARIRRLDLLPRLYDTLIVPDAVWYEVVLQGAGQAGAAEIETASWVQVRSATNRDLVKALRYELDAGEAEAIALALEIGAELLLMDEHLGREAAAHMGVQCKVPPNVETTKKCRIEWETAMFQEYELVKLTRDLPLNHLQAGMVGTVLTVFDEPGLPRAYEVEFVGDSGTTLAVMTVEEKDLEKR